MNRTVFMARLVDYANGVIGLPFEWGVTDCFTLTINALDYADDSNLFAEFVNQWTDEDSARKRAEDFYFDDWIKDKGGYRVDTNFVQAGDIFARRLDKLPELGIVVGTDLLASRPDTDVSLIPLSAAIIDGTWKAWRYECHS